MREMKDSGIKWIGVIPSAWRTARVKNVAETMQSGGTPDSSNDTFYVDIEGGIPWVAIADMSTTPYVKDTNKHISEEGRKSKNLIVFEPGTILYAMYASVGKVSELAVPATINQALLAIVLNSSIDGSFFKYALNAWEPYIISESNGTTQFNLNANKVANLCFPMPKRLEQESIVRYLDTKCTQVDTLIANVQAQIEKLKTYKQSLITKVVTKGLDPNVPMKDSGVDYLGRIPSGWSIISIGQAFTYVGGFAFKSELFTTDETQYQVLRIGNVKNDNLILDNKQIYVDGACAESAKVAEVHIDDILFTMTGTKGKHDYFYTLLVNENHTSDRHLFINQRVGLFRAKSSKIKMAFANYVLKEKRILDYIFLSETGTANQGNIGIENIARTKLYLPSLAEQEQIVSYLDEKCSQIDRLIALKEEKIEKLEQYKRSLIYEYVTGKREVI